MFHGVGDDENCFTAFTPDAPTIDSIEVETSSSNSISDEKQSKSTGATEIHLGPPEVQKSLKNFDKGDIKVPGSLSFSSTGVVRPDTFSVSSDFRASGANVIKLLRP
jgi:hypothetical protein